MPAAIDFQPDPRAYSLAPPTPEASEGGDEDRVSIDRVKDALRGLRYGEVTVVVQDGVIIQVERTERIRLGGRNRQR